MNGIYNAVLREEPHLVAPLLRIAIFILGVVVVDEVGIANVLVEGRVKRRVG